MGKSLSVSLAFPIQMSNALLFLDHLLPSLLLCHACCDCGVISQVDVKDTLLVPGWFT
jgi:hypothetical protein